MIHNSGGECHTCIKTALSHHCNSFSPTSTALEIANPLQDTLKPNLWLISKISGCFIPVEVRRVVHHIYIITSHLTILTFPSLLHHSENCTSPFIHKGDIKIRFAGISKISGKLITVKVKGVVCHINFKTAPSLTFSLLPPCTANEKHR